jgi:hypothetical protein
LTMTIDGINGTTCGDLDIMAYSQIVALLSILTVRVLPSLKRRGPMDAALLGVTFAAIMGDLVTSVFFRLEGFGDSRIP